VDPLIGDLSVCDACTYATNVVVMISKKNPRHMTTPKHMVNEMVHQSASLKSDQLRYGDVGITCLLSLIP